MIFKLIGALMIFAACTYTGMQKSGELKGRYSMLNAVSEALGYLETEIEFASNDLKNAFKNIDKNTKTHGLFADAAEKIEKLGIKRAWAYAVTKNTSSVSDADRELLLMLGTKLGMTDTKNQLKHIGYVKELITAQAAAAENEYKRLGRVYRGGGVLTGLFIILVVM